MAATITPGYVFGSTEQVTNAKLASLASGSISNIAISNFENGLRPVTIGSSQPGSPSDGDLWLDTSTGVTSRVLKSYDSSGVVFRQISQLELFNFTFNGDFEVWGAGTSAAPTGWTLAGASATVAKNTTSGQFKWGTASAALTRAGADATLYQDIDLIRGFNPVGAWQGKQVTFGAWVRATVASRVRLQINDGVGTTSSSYHTGGGSLEFLTVTRTLDGSATRVRPQLSVDTGDTTGQIDGAIIVRGATVTEFLPSGWRGRTAFILLDAAATTFSTGYYGASHTSATENTVHFRVPYKGVARNAHVVINTDAGADNVHTLRKENADTAIVVTVANGATEGADTTNEIAFAKGDLISVNRAQTGGSNTQARFSIEYEEVP